MDNINFMVDYINDKLLNYNIDFEFDEYVLNIYHDFSDSSGFSVGGDFFPYKILSENDIKLIYDVIKELKGEFYE